MQAIVFYGIACCVTHLYIRTLIEQAKNQKWMDTF